MTCPFNSNAAKSNTDADAAAQCPVNTGGSSGPRAKREINEDANEPIPQPPVHWFTGNLPEIDPTFPLASTLRLAEIYGDIFKLDMVRGESITISSHELIDEVMDEDRFEKHIADGLKEVRALTGDGLFSAYPDEDNWGKAHRVLMPVFGPLQISRMFPQMMDIVSQMILKWDRLGPENVINPLAFDTIAFCGFSYRFNSFYRDEGHPFAHQMGKALTEAGKRAARPDLENMLRIWSAEELSENVNAMWKVCDDLVEDRHQHPQPDTNDLLNCMLNSPDPKTGDKLSKENIRFNMVTFLVAGHETTSGTLSFLFYHLLNNPEKFLAAQAEVDHVVGDDALQLKHLSKLKYLEAAIRETLRFQGPIGRFSVHPKKDTVIGNKYRVKTTQTINVNLMGLHHDPRVWGDDAEAFRPERFLDGGFEALPANAWKPFGNGARACIGRAFAEQEMLMATALILQRFQVIMADPSYKLRLKSTLTVKPEGLEFKVIRRPGKSLMTGLSTSAPAPVSENHKAAPEDAPSVTGKPLRILYSSNAGTCKYLAEDLETVAKDRGFIPVVQTMDQATENLPKGMPVILISPSYEGKPADNARKFVAWLESLQQGGISLDGVKFAIFGVGNHEWTTTFHRIPKLLEATMPKLGAKEIMHSTFVDVRQDLIGPWEDWRDELIAAIGAEDQPVKSGSFTLSVQLKKPEIVSKLAGGEIGEGLVKTNRQIAGTQVGPAKMHMEVELPQGVTYAPGDYLVVLPTNVPALVKQAVRKFSLNLDDIVAVSGTNKEFLTSGAPITVIDILGTRVELSTPASKRQVEAIAKSAEGAEKEKLSKIVSSEETYFNEFLSKRASVLDILEDNPSAKLSFAAFLDMLKPMTPRQYSISSSPLASDMHLNLGREGPTIASLTYDVLEAPAHSGNDRIYQGVSSTYLSTRSAGSKIRCLVRESNSGFHLPSDLSKPIIMVAAGTGIAPMRGFIQQRASIARAGGTKKLGPALLYFGCRDVDCDFLYRDELKEWEALGAVNVRPAFSKRGPPASGGVNQCKYVYERMWEDREELRRLYGEGAVIYVCGSASKLAKSSAEVVKRIWLDGSGGKTEEDAEKWLQQVREVRYVSDVFD